MRNIALFGSTAAGRIADKFTARAGATIRLKLCRVCNGRSTKPLPSDNKEMICVSKRDFENGSVVEFTHNSTQLSAFREPDKNRSRLHENEKRLEASHARSLVPRVQRCLTCFKNTTVYGYHCVKQIRFLQLAAPQRRGSGASGAFLTVEMVTYDRFKKRLVMKALVTMLRDKRSNS